MRRGDGVGIEIGAGVVVGVRFDAETPGRVAVAAAVPIGRRRDDQALIDALAELYVRLGISDEPVRVAWFGPEALIVRVPIQAGNAAAVERRRGELRRRLGVTHTMFVEEAARSWLLAVNWDERPVARIERLARRSGFADVTVEPSPLALQRVLDPSTTAVRRCLEAGNTWTMVTDRGALVGAIPSTGFDGEAPGLVVAKGDPRCNLGEPDDPESVRAVLGEAVDDAFTSGALEHDRLGIHLLGDPYPMFDPADDRSPPRVAVALGAALAAAGLAGRPRRLDAISVGISGADSVPEPWAVERIGDADGPVTPVVKRSWWRVFRSR